MVCVTYIDIPERERIKIIVEMMRLRAIHIEKIKKLLHPIEHHVAVQVEFEIRSQLPPTYGK
jgi:hypothetical protein